MNLTLCVSMIASLGSGRRPQHVAGGGPGSASDHRTGPSRSSAGTSHTPCAKAGSWQAAPVTLRHPAGARQSLPAPDARALLSDCAADLPAPRRGSLRPSRLQHHLLQVRLMTRPMSVCPHLPSTPPCQAEFVFVYEADGDGRLIMPRILCVANV